MWETFRDRTTKKLYYGNRETGESSWSPPPSGVPLNPFPAEDVLANWKSHRSTAHANELFFLNSLTGEKTWDRPLKFRGMPDGEEQNHESGPFIKYEDLDGRLYYYNARTKFVTRQNPGAKTLVSEKDAYDSLRAKGELWEGRAERNELPKPVEKSERRDASSSSDESASSSPSSEDDEDEEDPARSVFFELLKQKGVSKVSKWPNWLPKLITEPTYQRTPPDKARHWFEEYVRDLVATTSQDRAKSIQKARTLLCEFVSSKTEMTKEILDACIHSGEGLSVELKDLLKTLRPEEMSVIVSAVLQQKKKL